MKSTHLRTLPNGEKIPVVLIPPSEYAYDRPGAKWELIEHEDGVRRWAPDYSLEVIKEGKNENTNRINL